MNAVHKIAWRYTKSKKSSQAIHIISRISIIAITFSTAAMIILFSVYNGIEGITKELYTAFYPDIKVTPLKGKFFEGSSSQAQALNAHAGIAQWSYTLEDMALFVGDRTQKIGIVKGVNNDWFAINNLNQYMVDGEAQFIDNLASPQAIVGLKIAATLNLEAHNIFSNFAIYHPRVGVNLSANPNAAYSTISVQPSGIFRVGTMMDDKYVILPIRAASSLMERQNQFSTIDIKLQPGVQAQQVKEDLHRFLSPNEFVIADKYEQNKTLFMILNSEKWAVYAILLMVMLVASFNMIGSLTMLVLEKKKDIAILKSMGATAAQIQGIFLRSGFYLAGIGGFMGLVIGYLICWVQQQWGLVSMGGGFIVNAYPVAFKFSDFLLVLISVVVIGFIAAYFPATKAAKSALVLTDE